jgi:hypothetical protein
LRLYKNLLGGKFAKFKRNGNCIGSFVNQRTSRYVKTLSTPIIAEPIINPKLTKIPPSRVNGTPIIKLKRKSRNTILEIASEIIQRIFGISLKFGLI